MSAHASSNANPLRSTCRRRWSSSFTITLAVSVASNATPRGPSEPASSRLMSWRSVRNCRSSVGIPGMSKYSSLCPPVAFAMASLARATTSERCCGPARVANGSPVRLRASRTRVESTTSDSGPVPRSHSPRFGSSASSFMCWSSKFQSSKVPEFQSSRIPAWNFWNVERGTQDSPPRIRSRSRAASS
jgi:hypothetical protein